MLRNHAPIELLDEFQVSGPYKPGNRAMNPTLEIANNGDLLSAFMESQDHHITDGGVVTLARSTDDGLTWTDRKTIAADPGRHCYTNHGMTRLSDGSILLHIIRGKMRKQKNAFDHIPSRGAFIRSLDNGWTWSEYGEILDFPFWDSNGRGFSYGKVLELPDGRLMTPVYGVPKGVSDGSFRVAAVAFSYDNGHSWPDFSMIHEDKDGLINPSETDIIRTSGGDYLAIIRANKTLKLFRSLSIDGGVTWSSIDPTDLPGQCPALITLNDGQILCIYRDMRPLKLGMSCAVSGDSGVNWDVLGHLYTGANTDCAYPSIVRLTDGKIYCIYYTASYPKRHTGTSEIRGLLIQDRTR